MIGAVRSAAGRLSGFTVSVGVVTLIGIISIPLLTASLGKTTWGTLALIQTVSQFGGILVAFGWGATGAATGHAAPGSGERRRPPAPPPYRLTISPFQAPRAAGDERASAVGRRRVPCPFRPGERSRASNRREA